MKFKFELKHVAQAVAVAAALSAPAAQAAVTDWGVHDFVEVGAMFVPPGAFDDFFKFTMPAFGETSSVAVSNNLLSVLNITGGTVTLWEGTYGDLIPDTLKLSYSFDGTTGSTAHTVSGLAGGFSHYYEVSGTATGSSGGFQVLTSTLLPVPEPEAYAMLLAGLGLIGFVARRRKQSQDAAAA